MENPLQYKWFWLASLHNFTFCILGYLKSQHIKESSEGGRGKRRKGEKEVKAN